MNSKDVTRLLLPLRGALWKYRYVLLVVLVGAVLLLLPTGGGASAQPDGTAAGAALDYDPSELEARLEAVLSRVEGAGEVEVVLTVRSGPRQVLAEDRTQEREGGRESGESTTVLLSRGSAGEETVAVEQRSPQFRGALVVCSGGDDPAVRLTLTQAVSAVTGLGADRISICKGTEGK